MEAVLIVAWSTTVYDQRYEYHRDWIFPTQVAIANSENVHSGENNYGLPFVSNAIPFYRPTRLAEAAK